MRSLVVYQPYFRCTSGAAEAIADGLRPSLEPHVVSIDEARHHHVGDYDLLVLGAPPHAAGVREWFDQVGWWAGHPAAAFALRLLGSVVVTGRASTRITSELRRRKFLMVGEPLICLVNGNDELLPAEADRAHAWAMGLVTALDGGGWRTRRIEGSTAGTVMTKRCESLADGGDDLAGKRLRPLSSQAECQLLMTGRCR